MKVLITPDSGSCLSESELHLLKVLSLIIGWALDRLLGDPASLPHPIVWFGRLITIGERRLNRGLHRCLKGALLAITLVTGVFIIVFYFLKIISLLSPLAVVAVQAVLVFYFLAGTTLVREVRDVFRALDVSLEKGRMQVARIVGRDTSQLTADEVRRAALETLAENLSDGVVAPLFWFLLAGVPGMAAYKMANTLDSMIAYRTERYRRFGTVAARIDDVLNYLPARLTALLMTVAAGRPRVLGFVARYGRCHASPNSGYPESALAGVLGCRFGGGHYYFGEYMPKPWIGTCDRPLTYNDMLTAVKINRRAELLMVLITGVITLIVQIL